MDLKSLALLMRVLFVRGLTAPLFSAPLRRTAENRYRADADVSYRHPGPHEFGVVCGITVLNPIQRNGRVACAAEWSNDQKSLFFRKDSMLDLRNPWYAGPETGFSLLRFEVPDDVPGKTLLRCTLLIEDVDGALGFYEPSQAYSRNISMP